MKPQLKTLTWSDFNQFEPCHLPEEEYGDFSGTILDILKDERISNADKIWAFTAKYVMDDKTLRLFAVRCARQVQHLMTDQRSINALDVAERYANGMATDEELEKARDAAWKAARASTRRVARSARAAAGVAQFAAWEAARRSARSAWEATEEAAEEAAWKAVWEAAWEAQVQIAIELIKEFYQTTN